MWQEAYRKMRWLKGGQPEAFTAGFRARDVPEGGSGLLKGIWPTPDHDRAAGVQLLAEIGSASHEYRER